MGRHFACTACGKCCFGWLPLTLADALKHAGRFPLALVWTPVRQASRAFALTSRLGATMRLPGRRTVAVRIAPTAYIPPSLPCPELTPDKLCGIHADKPLRCRTMPFFPYRDEADQADLLIPRPGWLCDTTAAAPVVYHDKRIIERMAFDAERNELIKQSTLLRAHAEATVAASPGLLAALEKATAKPKDGHVVTNFASLLPRLAKDTVLDFARRQLPVLVDWAALTADDPALRDYHRHYRAWAAEIEPIAAHAAQHGID